MCVFKYHAFIFLIRPPRWQRETVQFRLQKTKKNGSNHPASNVTINFFIWKSHLPLKESIVHVQNRWMRPICGCYSSSAEYLSNEKPTKLAFYKLKHENGIKKQQKSAPAILSSFDLSFTIHSSQSQSHDTVPLKKQDKETGWIIFFFQRSYGRAHRHGGWRSAALESRTQEVVARQRLEKAKQLVMWPTKELLQQ